MNGRASCGFIDVVLSFKWQLLVSYGLFWPRPVASHFPSSASQVLLMGDPMKVAYWLSRSPQVV
jgi:hypothetical protein